MIEFLTLSSLSAVGEEDEDSDLAAAADAPSTSGPRSAGGAEGATSPRVGAAETPTASVATSSLSDMVLANL